MNTLVLIKHSGMNTRQWFSLISLFFVGLHLKMELVGANSESLAR